MKKTPQRTLGPPIVKAANLNFSSDQTGSSFMNSFMTCNSKMTVQFSATGSFVGVKLEITGTTIA